MSTIQKQTISVVGVGDGGRRVEKKGNFFERIKLSVRVIFDLLLFLRS